MTEAHAVATLILHGGIVFFVGMLVGLPYGVLRARGRTPESLNDWRVSHVQNLQNGFLLLFAGACTPYLELPTTATAIMVVLLVVAAYTDMGAWLIRPITGHTGLLPTPPAANIVAFGLFSFTVVGQFAGMGLFVYGAFARWASLGAA